MVTDILVKSVAKRSADPFLDIRSIQLGVVLYPGLPWFARVCLGLYTVGWPSSHQMHQAGFEGGRPISRFAPVWWGLLGIVRQGDL